MTRALILLVLLSVVVDIPSMGGEPVKSADRPTALLEQQIGAILAGRDRFVVLPPEVTTVMAVPGHLPCFVLGGRDLQAYYDPTSTGQEPIETALVRADGFYLLKKAFVVGWGEGGQFVIVRPMGTQAAVVDPAGVRRIILPAKPQAKDAASRPAAMTRPAFLAEPRLIAAFFVQGRWMYLTSEGVTTDASNVPIEETRELGRNAQGQVLEDALFLIANPDQNSTPLPFSSPAAKPSGLQVAVYRDAKWEHHACANPAGYVESVIRCHDGGLLAIGQRLFRISASRASTPNEAELTAALEAARNRDVPKLNELMAQLTTYPTMQLLGLSRLIEEAAGPVSANRQKPESDATRAIRNIGSLIGRGCQYYDGRWLERVRVFAQRSPSEALILAQCVDPLAGPESHGRQDASLLRIDDQGRLHELFVLSQPSPDLWTAGRTSACEVSPLMLVAGYGLARPTEGGIEWLDQSDRMRGMSGLLGIDRAGCVYLNRRTWRSLDAGDSSTWLFRPGGQAPPAAAVDVLDLPAARGLPAGNGNRVVVDDLGQLWMIAPERFEGVPGGALAQAEVRKFQLDPMIDRGTLNWLGQKLPNIYCRDRQGQIYRTSETQTMRSGDLQAGSGGAVFLETQPVSVLLQGGVFYAAMDAHQLAQSQFDRVLAAAPKRTPQFADSPDKIPLAQYLAVDRVLWVSNHDRLEAYTDGKSLGIGSRLQLLESSSGRYTVCGPLASADGPRLLLFKSMPGAPLFWATQKGDGIALERFQVPAGLGEKSTYVLACPLVDFAAGRVYLPSGTDAVFEIAASGSVREIANAGVPVLTSGGKLLVRRPVGFRWVDLAHPDQVQDLEITCRMSLRPMLAEDDDKLLCIAPDGLAWIRPDQKGAYVLAGSIKVDVPGALRRYLGRSETTLYVETDTGAVACIPVSALLGTRSAPAQ